MKAPDKIYIDDLAVVNDCSTKISLKQLPYFSEYIRKDALLEWLDGKMTVEEASEGIIGGYDLALKDVIKHIKSL